MANDNMRTGPRGASDQEAWQSPIRVRIPITVAETAITAATITTLNLKNWDNTAVYVNNQNVATNSCIGALSPGTGSDIETNGVNWRLTRLTAACTTEFAGGQSTAAFQVGVYSFNPNTAVVGVVDADAFCTAAAVTDAQFGPGLVPPGLTPGGLLTYDIPLDGVGAYRNDNGGTGTGLVSYELGTATGQNDALGNPIAGFAQFLAFSIGDGAQAGGSFVLYAEFVPSSGQFFGG